MDDEEFEPKFLECISCKNFKHKRICRSCDSGEFFDEKEPDGIDDLINGINYDR